MIDTDKYTGHTEGDWNWTKLGTMSGILLDKHGKDIVHLMMPYDLYSNPTDATAQLIADAPLLLAEVKRLREVLAEIKGSIDEYIHDVWDGNLEGWQCASDNIAALGIKSEWEEEE